MRSYTVAPWPRSFAWWHVSNFDVSLSSCSMSGLDFRALGNPRNSVQCAIQLLSLNCNGWNYATRTPVTKLTFF